MDTLSTSVYAGWLWVHTTCWHLCMHAWLSGYKPQIKSPPLSYIAGLCLVLRCITVSIFLTQEKYNKKTLDVKSHQQLSFQIVLFLAHFFEKSIYNRDPVTRHPKSRSIRKPNMFASGFQVALNWQNCLKTGKQNGAVFEQTHKNCCH